MDMKANFKSTNSKRYLLVKFRSGNVALYAKGNVYVDVYQGWKNDDYVEIEELQSSEVTDRLTEENWEKHAEALGDIVQGWFDIGKESSKGE